MEQFFTTFDPTTLGIALVVAFVAGVVKGIVGFAMPMIMISLLSSIVSPTLALAGLILPTVATNGFQALRQGPRAALQAVLAFRVFMAVGLVALLLGAQVTALVAQDTLLLLIGVPVLVFALVQLAGWAPRPNPARRAPIEAATGLGAGFIGGMSGVWGPPTVMLLTALDTPKATHMRTQGVIYGLGAVALVVAHIGSGVLTWQTAQFSALLVPSALLGMRLGVMVSDRFEQHMFRRATLAVLVLVSLNLVRRGLLG